MYLYDLQQQFPPFPGACNDPGVWFSPWTQDNAHLLVYAKQIKFRCADGGHYSKIRYMQIRRDLSIQISRLSHPVSYGGSALRSHIHHG